MTKFCIAFIFFLTLPIVLYPQSHDLIFNHLSVDQGLSNNIVYSIVQDCRGFMWFGTEDGLNKYDGYSFTVYRHDPEDSLSISDNWIQAVHESHYDGKHILWVGTLYGGLNRLDLDTEQFTHFRHNPNDPQSLSNNKIVSIYEDRFGELWIGTDRGINKFDRKTGKFLRYQHDPKDSTSLSHNQWCKIFESILDGTSTIWVGTFRGLNKFDRRTEEFTRYKHDRYNLNSLSHNHIVYLFADTSGMLWITTNNGGLNKFNIETEHFTRFQYDPDNLKSISSNMAGRILKDDFQGNKVLWISTYNGLNKLDLKTEQFTHYKHNPGNPKSLCDNRLIVLYKDKTGSIWIGTHGGGLSKFDPGGQNFAHFRQELGNSNSLSHNVILSITESKYYGPNVFWIGTKDGGLNKYDRNTGSFIHYRYEPGNENSLSNDLVFTVLESQYQGQNELWIGTLNGLNKFDLNTNKFTHYQHVPGDPYSIGNNIIRSIYEDKTGILWIGTRNGGLNKFDRISGRFNRHKYRIGEVRSIIEDDTGTFWAGTDRGLARYNNDTDDFTHYLHDPDDPQSLSHNSVITIYEDKSARLWIGTSDGLNLYNVETNNFTHYKVKDGLPNNVINGILEDDRGNLWLSTNHGLSKFNPLQKTFRNYDIYNGLQSNQFAIGASCLSKKGEMLFGGVNGFNVFHPDNISDNPNIPDVHLTDFQIFNMTVDVNTSDIGNRDGKYYLPKHISNISEITLSHKESVFSFEFAALDYHSPQKNRYAYKMDGIDPNWVYIDASRRYVAYTQLDPGEYVFQVKGSNNDGLWNEDGTSIKIIITPPWWRTNLAYAFYILTIGLIIIGVWRFQVNRLRMKHQMDMDHLHAEKLEEIDRMKSCFFTNISHEFRTPLTLILGPVKNALAGKYGGNVSELYHMIIRNGERLLQLVNQILDLSKLESGNMVLHVTETNLNKYIENIVLSFSSLAERKNITLKVEVKNKDIKGYIDRDKVEKIINNLISNAFKFTPDGGKILVDLGLRNSALEKENQSKIQNPKSKILYLSITNTGTGISSDQQNKIFDRFYQVNESGNMGQMGSGIGLALTKELVEASHGEISVSSIPNKTTTFFVTLPVSKEYYREDELSDTSFSSSKAEVNTMLVLETENHLLINQKVKSDKLTPLLLIVEDNPDVTSYICSFMENDYNIITAENGSIGLKKAFKKYPDLIISDIMMPEMDGFELCKKIKTDKNTSHIPVILLTAKADISSKMEGLEYGADDYISKPFDADELKVRSKNLIEQRKKLREKFTRVIDIKPGEITATSLDEQFLKRLLDVFENHISEADYGIESFAKEIGMSRSNLYRKLRALTNQSTDDFIRSLRLKRAAQLLRKRTGTVSEVAYAVGFNSPSHFSKIFRQHFGQSPSDFANHHKFS